MKPAFPVHPHINTADNAGMTLRDYFASKAMQGLISAGGLHGQYSAIAIEVYLMADAMLKARETS